MTTNFLIQLIPVVEFLVQQGLKPILKRFKVYLTPYQMVGLVVMITAIIYTAFMYHYGGDFTPQSIIDILLIVAGSGGYHKLLDKIR
jgi:hypothetical protein